LEGAATVALKNLMIDEEKGVSFSGLTLLINKKEVHLAQKPALPIPKCSLPEQVDEESSQ